MSGKLGRTLNVVAVMVGLAAVGTQASAAAIDFTSSTIEFSNGTWSLGFEFTVNTNFNVTRLGFYDSGQDGLTESHDVGIFNNAGALLVSGTVLNSHALDGFFRYVGVAPTLLAAGQNYRIAAVTGTELYTWDPNGFTTDPAITFLDDRFTSSTTLVFPTESSTEGVIGWFGPNFDGDAAAVPEPGTLLLLGGGLAGLAARRRRAKQ